ncbi:Tellurite resistance protein TehB [Campylobacter lari]|uniref:class I SAM-dependent methyltransferase n=1 Tax=Campylobacter lari TaxID=201 RepID=UPI000DF0FEA3|nr:class I SAM-dependent methyltransferase [Campylobacter lari]MCR6520131.1 class I SAM-dependent methyltransferase [Campylobacter lari]STA75282.1 Tellurite resistance protein TehB [Campylobacter lari]
MDNKYKWEELYNDSRHHPRYPHNEVVTFVLKNFKYHCGIKILDLGCGAGRHLKFLAENGFDTYGCDYSEKSIKICQKLLENFNVKLDVSSMDNLPYEDNFFDGLICYGVLYYGTKLQIEKSIQEIHRVLKNKGKAFVVVRSLEDYRYSNGIYINNNEVVVNEKSKTRSGFKENGMHINFFNKKELRFMFSRFKSVVIDTMRISHENGLYADEDYLIFLEK